MRVTKTVRWRGLACAGFLFLLALPTQTVRSSDPVSNAMIRLPAHHATQATSRENELRCTVEFDCTMSDNDAATVITAEMGRIRDIRWEPPNPGATRSAISFSYNPKSITRFRVNATRATSANNGVKLDGNVQPPRGVAPNGDDFTFTIPASE
jgi:hypothetical protein